MILYDTAIVPSPGTVDDVARWIPQRLVWADYGD
jgi:hypothetical protein